LLCHFFPLLIHLAPPFRTFSTFSGIRSSLLFPKRSEGPRHQWIYFASGFFFHFSSPFVQIFTFPLVCCHESLNFALFQNSFYILPVGRFPFFPLAREPEGLVFFLMRRPSIYPLRIGHQVSPLAIAFSFLFLFPPLFLSRSCSIPGHFGRFSDLQFLCPFLAVPGRIVFPSLCVFGRSFMLFRVHAVLRLFLCFYTIRNVLWRLQHV